MVWIGFLVSFDVVVLSLVYKKARATFEKTVV